MTLKDDFATGVFRMLRSSNNSHRYVCEFGDFEAANNSNIIMRTCQGRIDNTKVRLVQAKEDPERAARDLGLSKEVVILVVGRYVRGEGDLTTKSEKLYTPWTLDQKLEEAMKNFRLVMGVHRSDYKGLKDAAQKIVVLVVKPAQVIECWR